MDSKSSHGLFESIFGKSIVLEGMLSRTSSFLDVVAKIMEIKFRLEKSPNVNIVGGTRELVGEQVILQSVSLDDIENVGFVLRDPSVLHAKTMIELAYDCVKTGCVVKADLAFGPYLVCEYTDMVRRTIGLAKNVNAMSHVSRQLAFNVSKEIHCFQGFQFLLRKRSCECCGDVVVISNMRSCNFNDNLLGDIYISLFLASLIVPQFSAQSDLEAVETDLIMNIGSLHSFIKKEGT